VFTWDSGIGFHDRGGIWDQLIRVYWFEWVVEVTGGSRRGEDGKATIWSRVAPKIKLATIKNPSRLIKYV